MKNGIKETAFSSNTRIFVKTGDKFAQNKFENTLFGMYAMRQNTLIEHRRMLDEMVRAANLINVTRTNDFFKTLLS